MRASQPLSLHLDAATWARLETQGRDEGLSPSELASAFIEEGLRRGTHPRIVFRPGPAGRRPGLSDGLDVWEAARVVREFLGEADQGVATSVELTGLAEYQVRAVLGYYLEFRDEIDDWIRRNDEEADRAEAAWRQERGLPVE